MKQGLVLYLQVHQPYRVREYSVFDTSFHHNYFLDQSFNGPLNNQAIFEKVANKSYRPMNNLLEGLLARYPDFKISLSITGVFLEQAEAWAPDVLESFKRLTATGRVELLAETYHHSLAYFYNLAEFEEQVLLHRQKIKKIFGVEPQVFRNTELAYNDSLAQWAEKQGYKGILAEGWDNILLGQSPNQVFAPPETSSLGLLLKNYRLSDDIAFRFGDRRWSEWPLSVDQYIEWLKNSLGDYSIINLFMDYETFGEHQWQDTGIFEFFERLIGQWSVVGGKTFYTVSEAIDSSALNRPVVSMPDVVTWADSERDLTAWNGNSLQQEALRYIYDLAEVVLASQDLKLIDDWRKLQTSDHFYYMCTKWFADGDVHAYFSPYESPYDAFLYFLNVIRDLRWRAYYKKIKGGYHG